MQSPPPMYFINKIIMRKMIDVRGYLLLSYVLFALLKWHIITHLANMISTPLIQLNTKIQIII